MSWRLGSRKGMIYEECILLAVQSEISGLLRLRNSPVYDGPVGTTAQKSTVCWS